MKSISMGNGLVMIILIPDPPNTTRRFFIKPMTLPKIYWPAKMPSVLSWAKVGGVAALHSWAIIGIFSVTDSRYWQNWS